MILANISQALADTVGAAADSMKIQPYKQSLANEPVITVFTYIKVIFILAFIVVLILLAVKLLKKFSPQLDRTGDNNTINIKASTWLGPKKSLYLVKIASKYLLIGVTENNINLIKEIEEREDINMLEGQFSGTSGNQSFSNVLTTFFKKNDK